MSADQIVGTNFQILVSGAWGGFLFRSAVVRLLGKSDHPLPWTSGVRCKGPAARDRHRYIFLDRTNSTDLYPAALCRQFSLHQVRMRLQQRLLGGAACWVGFLAVCICVPTARLSSSSLDRVFFSRSSFSLQDTDAAARQSSPL